MGALAVAVVAVAVIAVVLLGSGGSDYVVHARFVSAAQIVKGDQVQVAGRSVGSVEDIELTDDGQASLELHITDKDYAPLKQGVQATVRQGSLSGVANRYIDLRLPSGDPGPIADDGMIPLKDTTTAVDLDQLFNTFDPKTRKALSGFIKGQARSLDGNAERANAGLAYLNPSLVASSRLFREINKDTPTLVGFVENSADLVTTVAARRDDLSGAISNLADTTRAIADRDQGLDDTLQLLPPFMRRADTTFVNLRAALDDLDPAIDASKPVAKKLRPLLAELRPTARDARPTLRDLADLIRRPGAGNDLIELQRSQPAVTKLALDAVQADGQSREGTFPATIKALKGSTPELAYIRPYAVDLTGWFDDFGHSGIVDALGGASRAAPHVNAFASANGVLSPLLTPVAQQANLESVASLNQRNRCPGAVERGSAYKPTPDYNCDLSQQPLGP